jgi:hypothetical protein
VNDKEVQVSLATLREQRAYKEATDYIYRCGGALANAKWMLKQAQENVDAAERALESATISRRFAEDDLSRAQAAAWKTFPEVCPVCKQTGKNKICCYGD